MGTPIYSRKNIVNYMQEEREKLEYLKVSSRLPQSHITSIKDIYNSQKLKYVYSLLFQILE